MSTNGHTNRVSSNGARKTETPAGLTLKYFMEHAKHLLVTVNGATLDLEPKLFNTASFGWFLNEKIRGCSVHEIGGVGIQANMVFTIIGSKDAPRE